MPCARCWTTPAQAPALDLAGEDRQVRKPQGRGFLAPEPPSRPARLTPGGYEAALERYEREVIVAELAA